MISLEALRSFRSPNAMLELIGQPYPGLAPVILDALSGAPPTEHALAVWSELSDQPYPEKPTACGVLESSRGTFKSTILADLAEDRLVRFDAKPFVAPGSEVVATIVSTTKANASAIIRNRLPKAQAYASLLGGTVEERGLATGAEIVYRIPGLGYVPVLRAVAADEATIRGGAFVFVGWSEAGWYPSSSKSKNTLAVLRVAVVPRGLGQFPYFLELAESTNGPPAGWYYETCTKTPSNVLLIRPKDPALVNPLLDVEKLRRELSHEEFEQEILCTTWGLKAAAWFPVAESMAIVDTDAEWTDGTIAHCPGARVSFDHGGKDEIATMAGWRVSKEVSPGNFVDHLVCIADYWRPGSSRVPTRVQLGLAKRWSLGLGGVSILTDGRGFGDAQDDLASSAYKAPDVRDDAERRRWLARGGRTLLQMPMDPKHQTERFSRGRELIRAGRVHVFDNEAGRELARQLVSARATQLASRYLKIEAESGAEDGLLDCFSYLAEAFDSMPAVRADGTRRVFVERRPPHYDHQLGVLPAEGEFHLLAPDGTDLGRCGPDPADRSFPQFFVAARANGVSSSPEIDAFVRMRLSLADEETITMAHLEELTQALVDSGEVPARWAPAEALGDPMERLKAKARRW